MEKITIVFVQPTLKIGGSERTLFSLIRGLDANRFRPVLCCLYGLGPLGEQLEAEGYPVHYDVINSRHDVCGILRVAGILRRERSCILYMTNALLNVAVGRLAAFVARVPLCVIVFHSQDALLEPFVARPRRVKRWLTEKTLVPHFDRAIAVAETHKAYLVSSKHIPAERISVIHNGIDLRQFVDSVDTQRVRRRLKIPDGARAVGIVASLWPWKAHDIFLRSAAILAEEVPNTYFVVVGDGPERGNLEKMARDLAIADRVRFLGAVDDVPAVLRCLDLSVLSSAHEVFPLALLESMAAACPVVATNVGSIPEIVVDGLTGILVPPGAPDLLAQEMLRVLTHSGLARRLGEEGRKRVEELFTVERMISRTESLLLELVSSKGHPGQTW
jgi:glycosyltransferase involved in cell wall biosynthesis